MAFVSKNSDCIKIAVDLFDWESALTDFDVNNQLPLFNDTITNSIIIHANEINISDDREPPLMKTPAIK